MTSQCPAAGAIFVPKLQSGSESRFAIETRTGCGSIANSNLASPNPRRKTGSEEDHSFDSSGA
jgi:hypothetical protein